MTDRRSHSEVSGLLARTAEVQQEADGLRRSARALVDASRSRRQARCRVVRRCYGANPEAVPLARRAVARLAQVGDLSKRRQDSVRLAVSEAVTNVVVHAYGGGRGCVHLTAALAGDELVVLVADDGHRPRTVSRTRHRGWGWALIASACDEFTIGRRSNGGTQVEMRWRLAEASPPPADRPDPAATVLLVPPQFSTNPEIDRRVIEPGAEAADRPSPGPES